MLISSPTASPFFFPTVSVVGGLLGGTLLLLLVTMRFDIRRLRHSVLFERWCVWAVIAPAYTLALLAGELTTTLFVTALVFQGLREYARLAALPKSYERILVGLGLLAPPVALLSFDALLLLPPLLLMAGTLQPLLLHREAGGVRHLAFAAFGWGYIAWFLAHVVLLYKYVPGGSGILLATGLGTALSDVGAFTVGKLFGRRKLAPRLSPNKTWEGVLGNVLGAYLGVGLMAFVLPPNHFWPLALILPLVIAVGAIWGDLLESAIKREFQAKDAGAWLPGFGGLLDRIDSLIIIAPLVFYSLRLVG